jgi:prepilin-type N-terminal cleavage/methylation domain-containing protein
VDWSIEMTCRPIWFHRNRINTGRERSSQGFTLIELLVTLLVATLVTAMAVPLIGNVMGAYRLRSAVASVTGLIQSARFQAISSGYAYQVVFTKATSTFQVQSDPNRTSTFTNYCVPAAAACAVPLSNSGVQVVLGADTTLQFRPSGIVTATTGSTTLTIAYGSKIETITVSSYGNIKVTP